ncbi:MAG TPA: glycoside hydrolase domain-containing protein [Candidatus Limnocylindrales bacterium]|nr:glycoside hydrolase domain-containing protein [Candidatus Limnocylindrales bacterium]
MSITIFPRSVWGVYASQARREHASAPPVASSNPNWSPGGGVFIHHRGRELPWGGDYPSEEDCRRDIAAIYEDHVSDTENFDGDIAYNFLICQHGHIYQGRGYERGEANTAGTVDGFGRNAGFYSICALLRSNHLAGVGLLQGFRSLIEHLRTAAPRLTGARILPHSHEFDTECPGNLTMYAQQGSTIDPAAPWTGLADIQVHTCQKWVNAAYSQVPGYIRCPEDGRTGWATVLSLTQGLQHELGISPTVQNFGPTTFQAVRSRDLLPSQEFRFNLIRIYNGALWCKGYWSSTSHESWTSDSQDALERLYSDAGLNYGDSSERREMWPYVANALLCMDQFRLVPGGDPNVRYIQRRLNTRYVVDMRIPAMRLVACDGYYSRETQQGLMMAIQYEIGIPDQSINGYFGPGTQAGLLGTGSGALTGHLRFLFRSACYFNSPTMTSGTPPAPLAYSASDLDTDIQTASHVGWVRAFQQFSQIPVTGTNDYTTWAQLLVSTGDSSRPAAGCDCITEITAQRGNQLYAAGYRIVGRYLDEHLAPDDPYFLNKALKPAEPQTILDAGLKFFPLFQYNGTQLGNFTFTKGYEQGTTAHHKAIQHRIPAGTCIYFAVDYDALDVDIDSNIKPYFLGVKAALAELGNRYSFGVYGSRNVCTRISREVGARWSLVSGMSWGYSGNLGFPLPENWSFNQICEYQLSSGWGIDHNVWRHSADPGVSHLDPNQ